MKKRKSAAAAPPQPGSAAPAAPEVTPPEPAAPAPGESAVMMAEEAVPVNVAAAADTSSASGATNWEGPTQVDALALDADDAEILQVVDLDGQPLASDGGADSENTATGTDAAGGSIEPVGDPAAESSELDAGTGQADAPGEATMETGEGSVGGAAGEADVSAEDLPGEGGPEVLAEGAGDEAALPADASRLESVLESLLFATDRALAVSDLKRLLGERDGKRLTLALETLRDRRADSGIQLVSVAGGWQLRTHPANGEWVAKLVAGRPQRLSRAMMETLAIVAYRQPITRPEIDEIRGVDCGPVLRTLLDRGLIRVIGKKEEVGRPILYGTTPEFLKTFSLRDLTDLPTLREFHELGAAERAEVDATLPGPADAAATAAGEGASSAAGALRPTTVELPNVDPDEEEALLEELEQATQAAGRATASALDPKPPEGGEGDAQPAADAAAPAHGGES
jgi:segregation and condensation protein B